MEEMLEVAKKVLKEVHAIQEAAEVLRVRTQEVQHVVELTKFAEEEEERLKVLRAGQPCDAQIGKLLNRNNIKISDIIIKWDTNGNGTITKKEFRANVRELGVVSDAKGIDKVFDEYDLDKGGSLDLNELRPALKKLEMAAKASQGEEAVLEKAVRHLWRKAKHAQQELAASKAGDARRTVEAELSKLGLEETLAELGDEAIPPRLAKPRSGEATETAEASSSAHPETSTNHEAKPSVAHNAAHPPRQASQESFKSEHEATPGRNEGAKEAEPTSPNARPAVAEPPSPPAAVVIT